jgi:hypothetical protein
MNFVDQIKQWCREGEADLRRENKLMAYAQFFAHDIIERWAEMHGRRYIRPQPR